MGNDGVAYGQRLWAAAQVIALSRYEAGEDFRYMRITLARCTELLVPLPRVSTGTQSLPVISFNVTHAGIMPGQRGGGTGLPGDRDAQLARPSVSLPAA